MADDDDYTMGDVFNSMRAASQQRRADNRERSAALLAEAGISAVSNNAGAHLVVAGGWDFWPGTGLWKERAGRKRKGRGVFGLIRAIKPSTTIPPKTPGVQDAK